MFKNILLVSILIFTGCATTSSNRYSTSDVGSYSYFQRGYIERATNVELSDSGVGTVAGAVIGGVLGNQIGRGSGRTLATVGGAVAGGYVGNQVGKDSGQELIIRLDNGNVIREVHKGNYFRSGDSVRVEFYDGKIRDISLLR